MSKVNRTACGLETNKNYDHVTKIPNIFIKILNDIYMPRRMEVQIYRPFQRTALYNATIYSYIKEIVLHI